MAEGIVIGNLTIPVIKGDKGDKGNAGEIVSISLVLLSPTATPYVINNGSTTQAQIELGIPKGLSVSTTNINASGELVFTFNDNSTVNVGKIVGKGISEVTVTEDFDFVVTYTDGTSVTACNLEEEILGAINDILEDYYTKTEIDEMGFITKEVNNLTNYTLKTNTGSSIELSINNSTYVMTLNLKNSAGTTISTGTIDLPLETMVVGATYDNTNKKIVLTLKNGSTIDVPVADLISGLQSEITSSNKLSADLVDDTSTTHKFTSTSEKNSWNAKYDKPSGGIPSTDLSSSVQTSLGKADTAIQEDDLSDYIKNTDLATTNKNGLLRGKDFWFNYIVENGRIMANVNTYSEYNSLHNASFISKGTLNNVIIGKQLINQSTLESSQQQQDNIISDLKTKNELLVKDHVPIENTGTELQLTGTGDLPMSIIPYGNISQETTSIAGGDEYDSPSIEHESQIKVVDGEYEIYSSRGLPKEYQEVEYISSTSARTQYIDLNRMTNKDNVTKFKIETSIQWNSIIANAQYSGANGGSFLGIVDEKYSFGGVLSTIDASTNKFDDIEFEINYNTRNINYIVNGVQNQGTRTNAPVNYKLSIFGIFNSSQEISFMCDCKIKYFKIYEDDNIIFNLIPCYRKSDNVIGMYDLVNDVFYTNAGTGSFNKGQNQNTVYLGNPNNKIEIDTSPNPLYSENDYYKYLTSEEATFLGLNTGAGWYVYNKWDNQDFTSGVSSVTINDMKSNGQFYSTVGGTVSGTTITFSGTTTGNGNIVYELATPTYTKITDTDLINSLEALKDMQSYYDVTNISQTHSDGQADMIINTKALKSLKAMQSEIDNLISRVTLLED